LAVVALAGVALCQMFIRPADTGYTYDTTVYLAGAQSLAEGNGYRFVAHEGTPRIGFYPPLQSSYLSLAWRLTPAFPGNIPLLVMAMILLSLVMSGLLYSYLLREGVPQWGAGLSAVLFAASPLWFGNLVHLYADTMFTLLGLAVACLWQASAPATTNRRWLITGFGFALMYLAKSSAAAPMAATFLVVAVFTRPRRVGPVVGFVVPVLLAVLSWKLLRGASPSYWDALRLRWAQEGGLGPMLAYQCQSAWQYLSGQPVVDALFPAWVRLPHISLVQRTGLGPILSGAVLLSALVFMFCVVLGFRQRHSPLNWALGWIVAAYLLQLIIWPYYLGPRALFAILPYLLGWSWHGFLWLAGRGGFQRWVAPVAASVLACGVGLNLRLSYKEKAANERLNSLPELREIADWIGAHVPPSSRLAAGYSLPVLHLHAYTGRMFVEDYFAEPVGFVPMSFRSHRQPADYLVSERVSEGGGPPRNLPHLDSLGTKYPGLFQPVKESSRGRYVLLRINPDQQEQFLKYHFPAP
jgi:hypothetical protein